MNSNVIPLTKSLAFVVMVSCLFAACSRENPPASAPKDSFEKILAQFNERAASKPSSQATITVTSHFITGEPPATPAKGTIQVRKVKPLGGSDNAKETEEIIDLEFTYKSGNWHCSKGTSKGLEGDRVTSQNTISGPDISLTNLFSWVGL